MFQIDFTRPHLYKDTFYLNQGNLSTNNTFRCKVVTGGEDDLTGATVVTTFVVNGKEMHKQGVAYDGKRSIIDIIFPSDALVVGTNQLNFLINRKDGSVAQSPVLKYTVWQGLTTDASVEADSKYPLIIALINSVDKALNDANLAICAMNNALNSIGNSTINADKAAEKAILAANNADSKVDEKIGDVDIALAAGTVDLEIKEARKDASGFVHDTVKQRLDSDLIVGDKSLKDFVIDMNGMKESQDLEYETDKGYLVCKDTQSGVVKDLKVYGKSLVNVGGSNFTWSRNYANLIIKKELIKPSTKYGFKLEGDLSNLSKIYCGSSDDLEILIPTKYNTAQMIFTSPNINFTKEIKFICYNNGTEFTEAQVKTWKLTLIECDSLDKMPSYFEGIASAGNGNEIEVSSGSKNIAHEVVMGSVGSSGEMIESSNSNRLNMTRVIPNTKYVFSKDGVPRNCNKFFYDIEGNCIGQDFSSGTNSVFITSNSCYYVALTWGSSQELGKYQLEIGATVTSYVEPKQDKKTISFKDKDGTWNPVTELRGIDLNSCDTIEKDSDGKHYLNVRTEENILSGIESISLYKAHTNTISFNISITKPLKNLNGIKLMCDKFPFIPFNYDYDKVGISFSPYVNKNIFININKTELSTLDAEGFKNWLKVNNVTVIYPLSNEEVYAVNPIYPDSYENETMISFGSGAIAPHASWKITSSLPNFVKELSNQIKQLQEQVYKTNVANFAVALNTLDTKLRLDRLEAPQM